MGTIYYETAPMPQTDGTNIVVNGDGKLDLGTDVTTKLGKVDNKIDKPSSATDGQVLTYNGTSGEWEAQVSQGGAQFVIIVKGSDFEGQTVTATKDAKSKSAVITDGIARIMVDEGGVWTLTLTDGSTYKTPNMTYYGEYEVKLVPNGSIATPINDIQVWLKCAGITESYTSISQVLADINTLSALISDNNAVDYMVRSTTWASDVCNNESAMTYIGNNNYCANKLLANSTWSNAICNSTYFEKVLNVKVPAMINATNPYGRVESSNDESETYACWKAFDGDDSTLWSYGIVGVGSTEWISYEFVNPICPKKAFVKFQFIDRISDIKIEGYNGTTWELLANVTTNNDYTIFNDNENYYKKLRLSCKDIGSGTPNLNTLQFYGREEA